jgi:hypothetical protein
LDGRLAHQDSLSNNGTSVKLHSYPNPERRAQAIKEKNMKYLKMLGLTAVAAMALMAIGAGSASATTLEVNGVAQTGAVTLTATLEPGSSALLQLTNGSFANTCTESFVEGKTSTFTAESSKPIGGPISNLTFTSCTTPPVKADKFGSLSVEWISGTTNGTVRSAGAEVTVPSPICTLTCKTGEGVDRGVAPAPSLCPGRERSADFQRKCASASNLLD